MRPGSSSRTTADLKEYFVRGLQGIYEEAAQERETEQEKGQKREGERCRAKEEKGKRREAEERRRKDRRSRSREGSCSGDSRDWPSARRRGDKKQEARACRRSSSSRSGRAAPPSSSGVSEEEKDGGRGREHRAGSSRGRTSPSRENVRAKGRRTGRRSSGGSSDGEEGRRRSRSIERRRRRSKSGEREWSKSRRGPAAQGWFRSSTEPKEGEDFLETASSPSGSRDKTATRRHESSSDGKRKHHSPSAARNAPRCCSDSRSSQCRDIAHPNLDTTEVVLRSSKPLSCHSEDAPPTSGSRRPPSSSRRQAEAAGAGVLTPPAADPGPARADSATEQLKERVRRKLKEAERTQQSSTGSSRCPKSGREGWLATMKATIAEESGEAIGSHHWQSVLVKQEEFSEREHMKSLIESDDQTDFSAYLERRRQERQQRQDDDLEKKSRGAAAGATASEPMHLEAIFEKPGQSPAELLNAEQGTAEAGRPVQQPQILATLPGVKGLALLADAVVMKANNGTAGWKLRRQMHQQ